MPVNEKNKQIDGKISIDADKIKNVDKSKDADKSKYADRSKGLRSEQTGFDLLEFKPENIMQGIVFSEIIGKPRSMRMGRWKP